MSEVNQSVRADALIDSVADWLMDRALVGSEPGPLLEGCAQRLVSAGIPLWRAHLAFNTLHPQYRALGYTWYRDRGLEPVSRFVRNESEIPQWRESPYAHLLKHGLPFIRRRLRGEQALLDFDVLKHFNEQGGADYLAYAVAFREIEEGETEISDGMVGSWITDRETGFTNSEVRALLRIQQRIAVACKMAIREQITRNILAAYLGPDAGRRVLEGHIQRGDGEHIHSVIWFSDLRDSARLADTLSPETFLSLVNRYFECTAGAVLENGGEVLRFIGDAVLAIFPIGKGRMTEKAACKKALAAAREASRRMVEVNRQRALENAGPLAFGLGLHIGDVMYGNIGVPERVEFSVVGSAANEVARLEGLTKTLGREVLVSDRFAQAFDAEWESLGSHDLRGVGQPMEVFALPVAA
jgi:adenylate cyclase